jgi:uncharacterized protein YqgC (DUF456 family)
MNDNSMLGEMVRVVPGLLGSLLSLRWISTGTIFDKLLAAISGALVARFGGPYFAQRTGFDESLAGFLLGLLGLLVIGKFIEGWTALDLTSILRDALRKLFGLPSKEQ